MKTVRAKPLILIGIALAIAGFGYDLFFAGLPYQDPTVAQQQAWSFHKMIGETVLLTGIAVVFAGICMYLWTVFRSKRQGI